MLQKKRVLLSHGSGGKLTKELIDKLFLKYFKNSYNTDLGDSAILPIKNNLIAYTTDSYIIDPIIFPGGNIGKLSICGTINDLAVSASKPLYISVSFIIEEGMDIDILEEIVSSMAKEAENAGVKIVTGDTKVVPKGKCDKLYINTSGIGEVFENYENVVSGKNISVGDIIIVNGYIGDHSIAILGARENISFEEPIKSDCASLIKVIENLIEEKINIKFMRDITRGGLSTIVDEIVKEKDFGISLIEEKIPIREVVKSACEIFGYDPLYLANEGKFILIVSKEDAEKALKIMRKFEEAKDSQIIGEITDINKGKAVLNTITGGKKIINSLSGEILPRIC